MDIYSGAVLFSLIIYIAVGNYAGRRVKKLDDYFVAGRRAHVVMRAACIAAIFLILMELTLYSAGAVVNLSDPGIQPSEEVIIYAALNLLPELLGALLLAGIMAAGLSSASTFLSLVGFSVSNDLFRHDAVDDKRMLKLSRLITVYVQPYQEATGSLTAGGGINWLSGESLLVLAGPVVVLPTAWIAWRMIRKSYG
jgi:Na+/proline symporter